MKNTFGHFLLGMILFLLIPGVSICKVSGLFLDDFTVVSGCAYDLPLLFSRFINNPLHPMGFTTSHILLKFNSTYDFTEGVCALCFYMHLVIKGSRFNFVAC